MSSGLAERNWKPRRRRASSGGSSRSRSGLPSSSSVAALLEDLLFLLELRRRAGFLQVALEPLETPLDHPEVREDDLVLHRPHVARGIDGTGRVRHRRIAEHAHDVEQRVGVAERGDVEQGGGAGLSAAAPPMSANSTVAGVCFFGLKSAVS